MTKEKERRERQLGGRVGGRETWGRKNKKKEAQGGGVKLSRGEGREEGWRWGVVVVLLCERDRKKKGRRKESRWWGREGENAVKRRKKGNACGGRVCACVCV